MYVEIGAHNRNTTRLVTEKVFALVMSIIMIVSERIKCFASIDSCCLIFLFYSFSYGHVGWDHGSIYPPCKLIAVHCKMQDTMFVQFWRIPGIHLLIRFSARSTSQSGQERLALHRGYRHPHASSEMFH